MTNTRRRDDLGRWRTDKAHFEVHEGDHYLAWLADESMADGDKITFVFKTPDTDKHIHMIINWACLVAGHVSIMEGATWTRGAGGTTSIFNNRRQDPNTSGLLNNEAQTDFNQGSLLGNTPQSLVNTLVVFQEWLFGAANKGGGPSRGISELVLKKDTQYAIQLEADGANNAGFLQLSWYEQELYEFVSA